MATWLRSPWFLYLSQKSASSDKGKDVDWKVKWRTMAEDRRPGVIMIMPGKGKGNMLIFHSIKREGLFTYAMNGFTWLAPWKVFCNVEIENGCLVDPEKLPDYVRNKKVPTLRQMCDAERKKKYTACKLEGESDRVVGDFQYVPVAQFWPIEAMKGLEREDRPMAKDLVRNLARNLEELGMLDDAEAELCMQALWVHSQGWILYDIQVVDAEQRNHYVNDYASGLLEKMVATREAALRGRDATEENWEEEAGPECLMCEWDEVMRWQLRIQQLVTEELPALEVGRRLGGDEDIVGENKRAKVEGRGEDEDSGGEGGGGVA